MPKPAVCRLRQRLVRRETRNHWSLGIREAGIPVTMETLQRSRMRLLCAWCVGGSPTPGGKLPPVQSWCVRGSPTPAGKLPPVQSWCVGGSPTPGGKLPPVQSWCVGGSPTPAGKLPPVQSWCVGGSPTPAGKLPPVQSWCVGGSPTPAGKLPPVLDWYTFLHTNIGGFQPSKLLIPVYHVAYDTNFVSGVCKRRNFLPWRGISITRS